MNRRQFIRAAAGTVAAVTIPAFPVAEKIAATPLPFMGPLAFHKNLIVSWLVSVRFKEGESVQEAIANSQKDPLLAGKPYTIHEKYLLFEMT